MSKEEQTTRITHEDDGLLFYDRELNTPTLRWVVGGQIKVSGVEEAVDPADMADSTLLPPEVQHAIKDITGRS